MTSGWLELHKHELQVHDRYHRPQKHASWRALPSDRSSGTSYRVETEAGTDRIEGELAFVTMAYQYWAWLDVLPMFVLDLLYTVKSDLQQTALGRR